jgi:hypothetical protein
LSLRWRTMMSVYCLCLSVFTAGCLRRSVGNAEVLTDRDMHADHVDLRGGWRVRTVVPILRHGGFVVPMTDQKIEGRTISAKASGEFIGYETSYYDVKGSEDNAVSLRLRVTKLHEEGHVVRRAEPSYKVFTSQPGNRYIRLMYLLREGSADHDMAILEARDTTGLEQMTDRIRLYGNRACLSSSIQSCTLIPVGVSVVPEEHIVVNGHRKWVFAR